MHDPAGQFERCSGGLIDLPNALLESNGTAGVSGTGCLDVTASTVRLVGTSELAADCSSCGTLTWAVLRAGQGDVGAMRKSEFRSDRHDLAALEYALIAPLLFMILRGAIDLGLIMVSRSRIANGLAQGCNTLC
jgi:hypothetical protein